MSQELADRVLILEEAIAYQNKTIEELSEQLIAQWRITDQLRMKVDRLTDRFLVLEESSLEATPITKPPHY